MVVVRCLPLNHLSSIPPPSLQVPNVSIEFTTSTVYCLTHIPPNASTDNLQNFLGCLALFPEI